MDDEDRVLAYVQNRLDQAERAAFERDMAAMPDLYAEVMAMSAARTVFAAEQSEQNIAKADWERLSDSIDDERRPANLNRIPRLVQMAAVAVGAVVIWQVLAVPLMSGNEETGFVPVSEVRAEFSLRVGFNPAANLRDMTDMLTKTDAQIIDGPSALGLYTLQFATEKARLDAEEMLTRRGDLVRIVTRP